MKGPAATLEPGTVEPVTEQRVQTSSGDSAGDWLCIWCLNRVANEQDRFQYGSQDEFSFPNPAGVRFDIITFLQTLGCRESGVPTLDFTWFPGHAWSYCHCTECGAHLGWYYTGEHSFAGLIKCQLVRAVYLRI